MSGPRREGSPQPVLEPPLAPLLEVGVPVDLSNCAREPIRIPGSIQPHGVLLTVSGPSAPVSQVSANCADVFGRGSEAVLGTTLDGLFEAPSALLLRALLSEGDGAGEGRGAPLRVRARPGPRRTEQLDDLDCLVHRSGATWIIELEPQTGQVDVMNTFLEVRGVVTEMNRTESNADLYEIAVRAMRRLTGFDRVMLYRFDRDWNGEVCAEAKLDGLEPFRGLHYPASDIPAQARELYAVNWLRFIRDVDAPTVPVVPPLQPVSGAPLDLSFAALRSVSPIHCEYLRNMGVTASMSVSIIIDGTLAGLIACHHYSGPYVPAPSVRATCEFLAQTLSLLVGSRENRERAQRSAEVSSAVSALVQATSQQAVPLVEGLGQQAPGMLAMLRAGGVAWTLDGQTRTAGTVPDRSDIGEIRRWLKDRRADGETVLALEALGHDEPRFRAVREVASGVLYLHISDDQDLVFFRPEVTHTVDWGGNPHLKELTVGPDGAPRLSPRGSFALWRETVEGRSLPWEDIELAAAAPLRAQIVHQMYVQARELFDVAETLQRSLLPEVLPQPPGWTMDAEYRPAAAGVGGDWYDAIELPDGVLLLVVGDVAGHGLAAAGAMGQLRNALRAYAVEDSAPGVILARLDHLAATLMEASMATAAVVRVEMATGRTTVALAGHPAPIVRRRDGATRLLDIDPRPPLGNDIPGLPEDRAATHLTLEPGDRLLLFTDGVFERRGEDVDESLQRWADTVRSPGQTPPGAAALLDAGRPPDSEDDATLLTLLREHPGSEH